MSLILIQIWKEIKDCLLEEDLKEIQEKEFFLINVHEQ